VNWLLVCTVVTTDGWWVGLGDLGTGISELPLNHCCSDQLAKLCGIEYLNFANDVLACRSSDKTEKHVFEIGEKKVKFVFTYTRFSCIWLINIMVTLGITAMA